MSGGTTYAEIVASCRAPTPHGSPPPAAAAAAAVPDALRLPVRRQLDFPAGGDNLDDDDDDFLFRVAEEMERSLYEPTRRAAMGLTPPPPPVAPPAFPERQCICGRGPCDVVQKEPGRWLYVCSATPKCKDSAWCEEPNLHPNSQPAFWIHPEPNDPHAFNTPSNHKAGATTQVNVNPQGLCPNSQPAFWSHPEQNNPRAFNTPSNHMAGVTTRVNVNQQGAHATIPVNVSPQGATTPVNISPQDADATTPVNFRPQGVRSNGTWPICMCTAGKCKILKLEGVDYYVCHIEKGQGACAHRELVKAATEEPPPARYINPRESGQLEYNPIMKEAIGHNFVMMGDHNETRPFNPDQPPDYDEWPFDIVEGDVVPRDFLAAHPTSTAVVTQGSPVTLHQPVAMVELERPTKSPLPPKCTISPTTPRSGGCFRCHEEGHWAINCPKKDACFHCGLIGHWKNDCPGLHDNIGC